MQSVPITDRRFHPGTPISSTNETEPHDIPGILLKVALNTTTINNPVSSIDYQVIVRRMNHLTCVVPSHVPHTTRPVPLHL